jgi:hypothetical protein
MEDKIISFYKRHSIVLCGLFPFSPTALLFTFMFVVINFASDKLFGLVCRIQKKHQ